MRLRHSLRTSPPPERLEIVYFLSKCPEGLYPDKEIIAGKTLFSKTQRECTAGRPGLLGLLLGLGSQKLKEPFGGFSFLSHLSSCVPCSVLAS